MLRSNAIWNIKKRKKCGIICQSSYSATPDSVVEIGLDTGCLEVKCPFVCARLSFASASVEVPSFCLQRSNEKLQLKRKHQYYYQVQTQLSVAMV